MNNWKQISNIVSGMEELRKEVVLNRIEFNAFVVLANADKRSVKNYMEKVLRDHLTRKKVINADKVGGKKK